MMASGKMRFPIFIYSPVKQEASVDIEHPHNKPRLPSGLLISRCLILTAIVLAATLGGYMFGQRANVEIRYGLLAPAGDRLHSFVYDRTFAMAPTEQTAGAWARLFPENGGFIHHPHLASNFSGIAVFHQLHCLQALYYLYYDATGEGSGDGGHHHHHRRVTPPAHARHCFDYLRQALMCHADTNLEQYNYTLNGVTGWGEKQCRDYSAVIDFAEAWGGNKWA